MIRFHRAPYYFCAAIPGRFGLQFISTKFPPCFGEQKFGLCWSFGERFVPWYIELNTRFRRFELCACRSVRF